MKFSEQWLREWVNPEIETAGLLEQLTMAGLEVDGQEPVAAEFSGVIVARVIEVSPHPDADRLRVCRVDTGSEALQIVCGAANVRADLRVPLATIGARLPGDFKIRKGKLRGVESFGMLCSVAELGLAESAEGLFELPADAPVGTDIRDYLQLDDVTIEVDLTPNRADCLSIAGIAREVAMLNRVPVSVPEMKPVSVTVDDSLPVEVSASQDCPNYAGRIIRGVKATATSPLWLQERLRRSGIRPISAIVDVTNYVMLELGQPLHAFDLNSLSGGIVVRHAGNGERLTLLDEQELELDAGTLVIADQNKVLALAGIMGGLDSGVTDATVDIFLESAFFNPLALAGRARHYRLHTDSSHRFERGVDYTLQQQALERASDLVLAIAGGQAGPVSRVTSEADLPVQSPVNLRRDRIQRVLGQSLQDSQLESGLQAMGFTLASTDQGWQVTPPPHRFDIAIEADLVEEAARIIGYDNIESRLPVAGLSLGKQSETRVSLGSLRQVLVERGYQEAVCYSFVDAGRQTSIEPQIEAVPLSNPISADMAVMRTSLWPGLLQAVQYNQSRQMERVRLFESGLVFRREGDEFEQHAAIGGVIAGGRWPEQWGSGNDKSDYHDMKSDLEALIRHARGGASARFRPAVHPALHPGRSASVSMNGEDVGWIGEIHPTIADDYDFSSPVIVFQLDLQPLIAAVLPEFSPLSRFPAIRHDLALVVDSDLPAARLFEVIGDTAPDTLVDLQLFDVYEGEGLEKGKKSCALGLTFQGSSSTLIESEIEAVKEQILTALSEQLGASLR